MTVARYLFTHEIDGQFLNLNISHSNLFFLHLACHSCTDASDMLFGQKNSAACKPKIEA